VVTFLALLELIRLKQITASQPEPFADIVLEKFNSIPNAAEPAPAVTQPT
jgi:chromatin segregation and condensation protein Rec8/ScpA/Scc1 (kleisin family)